jgi:predicted nucleic acid-binding protein
MQHVLIDTDIIIDFSNAKNDILSNLLKKQNDKKIKLYTCPIVITEFFTDQKLKNQKLFDIANGLFMNFSSLPITNDIAYLSAKLLREKQLPFLGDAYIAAICLTNNITLATRNQKHFANIPNLKII